MTDHPKFAQTDHDVLDVIRHRWSPRAFDPERDVPDADLRQVFEAARWAPSSGNEQPWRFVVASRRRTPDAFDRLFQSLTPRNQAWAATAPVLVLVAVRLTREANDALNAMAWYDAGQGVAFLTLQATDVGLAIRQMQGFDGDGLRTSCKLPEPFQPGVVMALGYAGSPESLAIEAQRESERQPRVRRPISAFVFDGVWGRAFE
jgi:nitroreductase